MNAFPGYIGQYIELLKEAIKTGMTLPSAVLEGYELSMSTHVVDDPTKRCSRSIRKIPCHCKCKRTRTPSKTRNRCNSEWSGLSGYKSLLDFFLAEYKPNARKTLGASELPNGRKFYEHLVRQFTTLNLIFLKKFIKQDYVKSIAFKKKCMKSSTRLDSKATLQLS